MKILTNYRYSALLWIGHFLTDAIAAFALTTISLNYINIGIFFVDRFVWLQVAWYFFLYNFLAFFMQIFVGYFLDKIKDNQSFFSKSKNIVLISFVLYIVWVLFLNYSYILSILVIWLASCLFHLWWGNISLLSDKNKATNLWIFASWWVLGLSFWWFNAVYFPIFIVYIVVCLLIVWLFIQSYKSYEIELHEKNDYYNLTKETKNLLAIIIFLLCMVLVIRSAIWTNFQMIYILDRWFIFYLAVAAFLWKITGWVLEDCIYFKEKYFAVTWLISFVAIFVYSFYFQNIVLLLLWIFLIQIFVSPITIIIFKLLSEKRSEIIWFTFGMSLVLWFLLLKIT